MWISLYILVNKQVDFIVDVFVNLNFQFQGVYKEWLINFGGWVFFDKIFGSVIVFELSCGYCFNNELGDVVYLIIGMQYGDIFVGFLYDINILVFDVVICNWGGWELIVCYILSQICLDNYFCLLL